MDQPLPIPKQAATVILARQGGDGLQFYLLKRRGGSGFMAGLYVFPGGVVDPADEDTAFWWRHIDLHPGELNSRLGGALLAAEALLPYAVAAIRETLEEAGVLLAAPATQPAFAPAYLEDLRARAGRRPDFLNDAARCDKLRLSLSGLRRWAHWITPAQMRWRFDTRFFLTPMPDGQHCIPDHEETTDGCWITALNALESNLQNRLPLSPPTLVTLHQLLPFADLSALLEAARNRTWGTPIEPRQISFDGGRMVLEPWDPDHGRQDLVIDTDWLEQKVLPAGKSFSRIWFNGAHWRPVER